MKISEGEKKKKFQKYKKSFCCPKKVSLTSAAAQFHIGELLPNFTDNELTYCMNVSVCDFIHVCVCNR